MCYEELNLVSKLKVYMVLNDINQSELGRLLNVSQPVISRVLNKTKPSAQLEKRIRKLINDMNI
ncbi:hypothetical protein D0469_06925 [Peribacillus saganii]|uniref:HTH cro/C1-type domain-containing protein n=1 Tax=Peribacillus saganii TaxID=2303992 RepID=A0A372LQK1_9BACI|nr:hypothetical protein D0469_06925 [Peribacillus saganii]